MPTNLTVSTQISTGPTRLIATQTELTTSHAYYLATYLPAILIMTDGRSDGDSAGFMAQWNAVSPHVPVFGITFGDAEKSQLDTLAAQTSARVFDGAADLAGAFRAARGYN